MPLTAASTFLQTRVARRMLGLFVACALVPLGVVAVYSYVGVTAQLHEQAEGRVREASKQLAMGVLERLQVLEADLAVVAATLQEQTGHQGPELPDALRAALAERFTALVVATQTGRVALLGASGPPPPPPGPAEQRHLELGRALLAMDHAPSGESHLWFAKALAPPSLGRGVVWARIDSGFLWHGAEPPAGMEMCVLDEAQRALSCSLRSPGALGPDLMAAVRRAPAGTFAWRAESGERYLAAYWSLPLAYAYLAPRWTVVLSESQANVFAPVAGFRRTFPLAVLLTLLVAALLSSLQIRKILDPLAQLQAATQRVAQRDFTGAVQVASGDEFADLAASFNAMAARLREQFDEGERLARALRETGERLRENELRLNTILETAADGIVTTDEHGIVESVNATAEQMFGYRRGDVVGRSLSVLFTLGEEGDRAVERLLGEGRRATAGGRSLEVTGHRRDSTTFPGELAVAELQLGGRRMFTSLLRDISERKRVEEERATLEVQLRQAQKMETIGTLAGGIAHDFNNILTPILGYAELGVKTLPEGDMLREDLSQIRQAALRGRELVREMLVFSRRAGQQRDPVLLPAVVEEAGKLLRASLPTTIEMRQALDPATPLVLANANQIHQVIMNLGTNAYHAMRDTGGVLELRTDPVEVDPQFALAHPPLAPGAHARLSVRDTGHGMDGAVMQRLFEPFYTTKPVGEGTGLGLAVVHGIVASHQGAIVVESAPGQGTTFEVYLPPAAVPAEAAGMPSENTLGGRERLLVVDDDPAVARLVQRTLQGLGYHVTVRTDSVEALATFREGPGAFDLVITDHTMPQLTGIGLTAELRRTRPDVRVLMTTGAREAFTAEQRGAFGVLDCLMKPFSVDELAHAVRRALDARGPGARGGAADERAAGT